MRRLAGLLFIDDVEAGLAANVPEAGLALLIEFAKLNLATVSL